MQLAIYRSTTHCLYPDEALCFCYAFQPIAAVEHDRDGRLLDWTDSGLEPYAVVEIPDGCEITNTEDGWQLLVPEAPARIDAEVVYELALEQTFGLSVIRGPSPDGRQD